MSAPMNMPASIYTTTETFRLLPNPFDRANVRENSSHRASKITALDAGRNPHPLDYTERSMIPPMTKEEADRMILEATARARRVPPRFEVKPAIDWERLRPLCTGPIYEGFEEERLRGAPTAQYGIVACCTLR
jgi:hypothetical protein